MICLELCNGFSKPCLYAQHITEEPFSHSYSPYYAFKTLGKQAAFIGKECSPLFLATSFFQPGGGMQMCEPSTRVVSTLNTTGGDPQYGWCRASIHRRQVGSLRPSCHCVTYSRQRVIGLYGDSLPDNGGQGAVCRMGVPSSSTQKGRVTVLTWQAVILPFRIAFRFTSPA